jgi:hypothetical protein
VKENASASVLERSSIYRGLKRAARGSALGRRLRELTSSLRSGVGGSNLVGLAAHSTFVDMARRSGERFGAVFSRSSTRSRLGGLERVTRSSWLYRWFTTEPEPGVVVIDLRETFSVGPAIDVLDRVLSALVPAAAHARLAAGLEWVVGRVRAEPVRIASFGLLAAVLLGVSVGLVLGSLTPLGLGALSVLSLLALVGTRVRWDWATLVASRPARLVVAALEPPDADRGDMDDGRAGRTGDVSGPGTDADGAER